MNDEIDFYEISEDYIEYSEVFTFDGEHPKLKLFSEIDEDLVEYSEEIEFENNPFSFDDNEKFDTYHMGSIVLTSISIIFFILFLVKIIIMSKLDWFIFILFFIVDISFLIESIIFNFLWKYGVELTKLEKLHISSLLVILLVYFVFLNEAKILIWCSFFLEDKNFNYNCLFFLIPNFSIFSVVLYRSYYDLKKLILIKR